MSAPRILLTGPSGKIARELKLEFVRKACEVFPCSLRTATTQSLVATLKDLRPTHLIHTAAVVSGSAPKGFSENLALTKMLLEAAGSLPSQDRPVLVSTGSAAELGHVPDESLPVNEDFIPRPITEYGRSKWLQTQSFLEAEANYGQRILCLRIFNISVFSEPSPTIVQSWIDTISAFNEGTPSVLTTGDLSITRDFLSGPWVAKLGVALTLNPDARGIVNVASGRELRLDHVIQLLSSRLGRIFELQHEPAFDRALTPRRIVASTEKMLALLPSELQTQIEKSSTEDLLFR
jgi:GDP-4-dehydro-6-deoxy-D-mannose reductase